MRLSSLGRLWVALSARDPGQTGITQVVAKKQIVAAAALAVIVSFAAFGIPPPLAKLPPPDPDFIDAVWIARSQGLVKLAAADATILFEITDAQEVRALGVDAREGVLWAFGRGTLHAFGFDGEPLSSIPVPGLGEPQGGGGAGHVALSVNSRDGTVWLAAGRDLFHFDAHGALLDTTGLPHDVQDLALDEARSLLWVGTKKTLEAHDDRGDVVEVIELGGARKLTAIDFDPVLDQLWVALKHTLRRYDADGAVFETGVKKIEKIDSANGSGIWIATKKRLLRMDPAGEVLFEVSPFGNRGKIVDLVVDPVDLSAWTAEVKDLVHPTPTLLEQRNLG